MEVGIKRQEENGETESTINGSYMDNLWKIYGKSMDMFEIPSGYVGHSY